MIYIPQIFANNMDIHCIEKWYDININMNLTIYCTKTIQNSTNNLGIVKSIQQCAWYSNTIFTISNEIKKFKMIQCLIIVSNTNLASVLIECKKFIFWSETKVNYWRQILIGWGMNILTKRYELQWNLKLLRYDNISEIASKGIIWFVTSNLILKNFGNNIVSKNNFFIMLTIDTSSTQMHYIRFMNNMNIQIISIRLQTIW